MESRALVQYQQLKQLQDALGYQCFILINTNLKKKKKHRGFEEWSNKGKHKLSPLSNLDLSFRIGWGEQPPHP